MAAQVLILLVGGRRRLGGPGRLGAALDAGAAACGWDQDQRWTLARVAALSGRWVHDAMVEGWQVNPHRQDLVIAVLTRPAHG